MWKAEVPKCQVDKYLPYLWFDSLIDFLALHIFKKQLGFLNTIIFCKLMSKTEI